MKRLWPVLCLLLWACDDGGNDGGNPPADAMVVVDATPELDMEPFEPDSALGDPDAQIGEPDALAPDPDAMPPEPDATLSDAMMPDVMVPDVMVPDVMVPDAVVPDAMPPEPTCDDGMQNGDETDIDCGGPECAPCGPGGQCLAPEDCDGIPCVDGFCTPPTCMDTVQNGEETDVDCGGPICGPCLADQGCAQPSDCQSQICTDDVCATPACDDTVRNGDETDTDCGGPTCGPCADGGACVEDGDCTSGVCPDGVCATPACDDAVRNGDELDTDCGGPACDPCADGDACIADSDCTSGVCPDGACAAPTCDDTVRNGDEIDVDCGGSCPACADGALCVQPNDCQSGVCAQGNCAAPACDDGVRNGIETDVDCGGPCPTCADGLSCAQPGDCASGVCAEGACAAPTCDDTVRNGAEAAVDCGGPCPLCLAGTPCAGPDSCASGVCTGGACAVPACDDGVQNGGELALDCGGPCPLCPTGTPCAEPSLCESGVCAGDACAAPACDDGVRNGTETDVDCGGDCPGCLGNQVCVGHEDCARLNCRGGVCFVEPPVLDTVAPLEVSHIGDVDITLTGSNFQPEVRVWLNDTEVAVDRVDEGMLTVTPPASAAGVGLIDIYVENPDGGFVESLGAARYVVVGVTASITSPQGTFCDPFTCAAAGLDIIDPANPLPVSYRWTLNGQPVNGNPDTLDNLDIGDTLTCTATVGPPGATWELSTPTLTVLAGVATVTDYTTGPAQPVIGEVIRCTATPLSTNCGDPSEIVYEWYVNDVLDEAQSGSTYVTDNLADGDLVECRAAALSPGGRLGSFTTTRPSVVNRGTYDILSGTAGDAFGAQVSVSADLDGDSLNDMLVGAPNAAPTPEANEAGQVYAIAGKRDTADQQPRGGVALFTLNGESGGRAVARYGNVLTSLSVGSLDTQPFGDVFGYSVTRGARFFDDDAVPDFAVGAPAALSAAGDPIAGRAYMISGASASGLQGLGGVDTLIGGTGRTVPDGGDTLGTRMVLVQDFNGDGYDDLVASAPTQGANKIGNMYILPGGTNIGQVDISDVASLQQGRVIDFTLPTPRFDGFTSEWGQYFGSAGDLDGDGLGDLWLNPTSYWPSITSYVVWGRETTRRIDITDGTQTSLLFGNFTPSFTVVNQVVEGRSQARNTAASGGDFNGDGLDDLIFSTLRPNGQTELVGVYGRADRVVPNINQLLAGNGGFAIDAIPGPRTFQGAMGDLNGDGYDDIVVGHPEWNNSQGQVIVVYGRPDAPTPLWNDLVNAGEGFTLDGPWPSSRFGHSVDVGDVNGDGLADILVGAPTRAEGGAVMVYFGRDDRGVITLRGNDNDETLAGTGAADVIVAQGGNDTINGGGGDDAVNGGRGNDTIVISDTAFRRIDGGPGTDTLRTAGGLVVDLTALNGKVRNIERVDLTAAGADRLVVDAPRIMRNTGGARTLWVTGSAEDTVVASGSGWVTGSEMVLEGQTWRRFDDGPVRLMVQGEPQVLLAPSVFTTGLTLLETALPGDAVGDLRATDDGAIAAYALEDASGTLTVDANGVVRVAPGGDPNFEQNPTFDVVAVITDDDGVATRRAITVRVSNVDEAPVFAPGTPTAFEVQEAVEHGRVLHRYVATDPEGLSPTLELTDPTGAFELLADGTLQVATAEAIDFERTPTIDLVLTATDPSGNANEVNIRVTVTNLESLTTRFRHTYVIANQSLVGGETQRAPIPLSGIQIDGERSLLTGPVGPVNVDVLRTGQLALGLEGYYDTGRMAAEWPVEVSITIPDRIVPGQNVAITSSFTMLEGARLRAGLPNYSVTVRALMNNFAVRMRACVGGCQELAIGPFTQQPLFERIFTDFPEIVEGTVSADRRTLRGTGEAWRTRIVREEIPWDDYINYILQQTGVPGGLLLLPAPPDTGGRRTLPGAGLVGNRQIIDIGGGTLTATIYGMNVFGFIHLDEDITMTFDGVEATMTLEDGSMVTFDVGTPANVQIPAGADVNGDGRVQASISVDMRASAVNNRHLDIEMGLRWLAGHVIFQPSNPAFPTREAGPFFDTVVRNPVTEPMPAAWTPTAPGRSFELPLQLTPPPPPEEP
ncbi:MAG: FG-GAP-like repeat-containing protein [Bradymonadia bacterium]